MSHRTAISPERANGGTSAIRSALQNRRGSYQLADRVIGKQAHLLAGRAAGAEDVTRPRAALGRLGVTTAANAGVPATKAGLAAALLNASQQVGGALGLAILSALATARAHNLLAAHASQAHALTAGFQRALLVGGIFLLAAAVIALRTNNTHEDEHQAVPDVLPASA